jgi:RNA-binding protein YhbY
MHKENKRTTTPSTHNTPHTSTHELPISVQIGKQGLQETVIEEIKKHLKKRKLIKIKCLRYFLDSYEEEGVDMASLSNAGKMKLIAAKIQTTLDCRLISITGFTIVLWHKKT